MKLSDANDILRELRGRPGRTLGVLLLVLLVSLALHFLLTLSGEKARQVASQENLPAFEEAVRIKYTRVESVELLSRFLRGLSYSADARFDAKPFIVNNDVYQDLEKLLDLLPDREPRREYTQIELHALDSDGRRVDSLALEDLRISSADGEIRIRGGRHREQEHYVSLMSEIKAIRPPTSFHSRDPQELLERVESDPFWVIDYVDMSQWMYGAEESISELYSYFFVGLPTNQELLAVVADPITQRVAEENPHRRDLAIQKLYYQHAGYLGHLAVRELSLLTLDIQNISDSPLTLEAFKIKSLDPGLFSLLTEDELAISFDETEPRTYNPPVERLLPGEHLLVPLRIALGVSRAPGRSQAYHDEIVIEESTFPENADWWRDRPGSEVTIPISKGFSSKGDLQIGQATVRRRTLQGKADLRESFVDFYYVASAIQVIEFAGKSEGTRPGRVSLRQYDPTNVIFRGGDEVGSCPILYAEVSGLWERLGPVFPFAMGRNFATDFAIALPAGATKIKLVEEEQERSFIDGAWLASQSQHGNGDLGADVSELWPVDGQYTMLAPGDELMIELPAPAPPGTKLLLRGYYLPLLNEDA